MNVATSNMTRYERDYILCPGKPEQSAEKFAIFRARLDKRRGET